VPLELHRHVPRCPQVGHLHAARAHLEVLLAPVRERAPSGLVPPTPVTPRPGGT